MRAIKVEDAEMARIAREQELEVMRPELDTKPRVYYKNLWRYTKCFIAGSVSAEIGRRGRLRRGRERAAAQGRRAVAETTTDNYGDFKFDRLDENSGRYTVEISANGRTKTVDAKLGASISLGEIAMIVRYESDGSIVMITQNDHAQLSGLFAAHWGNEKFEKPRPYPSLVRAAMFHDRGWIRYETSPQLNLETGKTPNYREVPNDKTQLEAFEWAGDWLSATDPYAGLMITKHRTGLWQGRYGVITYPPAIQRGTLPPTIQEFIARSEAKQKVAAEKFDAKEFAINYNLLQVWDMMSLYICSTEVLKPDRIEPVPVSYSGAAGVGMTLTPVEANTIALDPYPFDQPSLTTNVIFRRLPQTKFKDSAELQTVYFKTAPQIASFRLVPAVRH